VHGSSVPLWQDEPYRPRAPLEGEARTDVCVIGAGVGGLATARRLIDAGLSVVVLERHEVASGASGRNGGFLIAGAAPMYHDSRRLWGRERAAAVHRATLTAQRELLEVAGSVGARHHFRVGGLLRLAVDADEAGDVRANAAALAEDGFPDSWSRPVTSRPRSPGPTGPGCSCPTTDRCTRSAGSARSPASWRPAACGSSSTRRWSDHRPPTATASACGPRRGSSGATGRSWPWTATWPRSCPRRGPSARGA
jgi:choline dehydrogenase-like flavoprotein